MFLAMGLVTVDLIQSPIPSRRYVRSPGGSCGNVITIASMAGVPTAVCARMAKDKHGKYLRQFLNSRHIDLRSLDTHAPATPCIVQKTRLDGTHVFQFRDPEDGSYLQRFIPPTIKQVKNALNTHDPEIIYSDRVFPGVRAILNHSIRNNKIFFLEPSHRINEAELRKYAQGADILKISSDHCPSKRGVLDGLGNRVQIITHGSDGLEYRVSTNRAAANHWRCLPAERLSRVVDTAGAGDWVSGSIIAALWHLCIEQDRAIGVGVITRALKLGSKSAAISCNYLGAQGVMEYKQGRDTLRDLWLSEGFSLVFPG